MSYKVLIVEDEEIIRNHIKKLIDWNSMKLEIVGEAENGNQAVELIEKYSPNIVLLDIRLPLQNGLEVLKKTADRPISFIAISAYKDFEYAYSCLNYKVSSYLLKPISKGELYNAVTKVKEDLDSIAADKMNSAIIKKQVNLSNKIIKSKLLEEIVFGYGIDKDAIDQKIKECEITFRKHVGVAVIEPGKSNFDNTRLNELKLLTINESLLDGVEIVDVVFPVDSCNIVIIMTSDIAVGENRLYVSFNQLILDINSKYAQYAGISNWHNHWTDIRKAFREAGIALSCKYFDDREAVFFFKKAFKIDDTALKDSDKSSFVESNIRDQILKCMEKYELEEAKQKFEEYFDLCIKLNTKKEYCYKFIDFIIRLQAFAASKTNTGDHSNYKYGLNTLEISRNIFSKATVYELKSYISDLVDKLFRDLYKIHYSAIPEINKVIAYIDEYYASNISLNEAAGLVYMSPAYFSLFFKQKTGMNFSNFLTKYRIDKAKLLLKKNIYNPVEISQMVGYCSYRYFRKIFKESTGMTPNEYIGNWDLSQ